MQFYARIQKGITLSSLAMLVPVIGISIFELRNVDQQAQLLKEQTERVELEAARIRGEKALLDEQSKAGVLITDSIILRGYQKGIGEFPANALDGAPFNRRTLIFDQNGECLGFGFQGQFTSTLHDTNACNRTYEEKDKNENPNQRPDPTNSRQDLQASK